MFKRVAAVTAATVLIFVGGSREPETERAEIIVAAEDPGTAAGRETKREAGTIEKDKEADVNDTKGTQTAVDCPDKGLGSASVEGTGGNHGGEEPAAAEDDSAGYIDVSGGEIPENDAGQAGSGDADNGQGYSDGAEIPDEALEEDGGASREDSGEEVSSWIYYGNCHITHYCDCLECTGPWYGSPTASGAWPSAFWTVAAGEDLPFGTEVLIGEAVYVVEDRGVDSGEIDIFVGDHQLALDMGEYWTEVYVRWPE